MIHSLEDSLAHGLMLTDERTVARIGRRDRGRPRSATGVLVRSGADAPRR
jgi:hypothetical protein